MKTYIRKFAMGECGFLVLFAAFDCIDDIKLVKQAVLSEILASLPEVITNRNGKKVLPHPPITRNHPGAGERRWKRPQDVSHCKELLEAVSTPMIQLLWPRPHHGNRQGLQASPLGKFWGLPSGTCVLEWRLSADDFTPGGAAAHG
uniref:pumilio homolog 3-like n=1 Tax=Oncorhynchus gorbuscha TaxID=8017 RepID=UPI001EAF7198|nr:pumilio homolog 3-like [Oncorhynchus gorbuscha]